MNIIEKAINEIIPYENNPRNNDNAVEYVKNSIQEFGFKVPIVIDSNNIIVAGHTRLKAAKELGLETVPCIIADDLTDEQIKAFRIADNKTAELAGWKTRLLDEELAELCEFKMELFGFPKQKEVEDEQNGDEPSIAKKQKMVKCPHCGEWLEAKKVKIKHD